MAPGQASVDTDRPLPRPSDAGWLSARKLANAVARHAHPRRPSRPERGVLANPNGDRGHARTERDCGRARRSDDATASGRARLAKLAGRECGDGNFPSGISAIGNPGADRLAPSGLTSSRPWRDFFRPHPTIPALLPRLASIPALSRHDRARRRFRFRDTPPRNPSQESGAIAAIPR